MTRSSHQLDATQKRNNATGTDGSADIGVGIVTPELLTQAMEQLQRRRELGPFEIDSAPEDVISAYDRMRRRKFSCNLLKGMGSTAAAKAAEADALESLATLARKRGIAAVNAATAGALLGRLSCGNRLLRRQSILKAAAKAINSAKDQETGGVQHVSEDIGLCETSTPYVRTRLRKRASLAGKEGRTTSEPLDSSGCCAEAAHLEEAVLVGQSPKRQRTHASLNDQ